MIAHGYLLACCLLWSVIIEVDFEKKNTHELLSDFQVHRLCDHDQTKFGNLGRKPIALILVAMLRVYGSAETVLKPGKDAQIHTHYSQSSQENHKIGMRTIGGAEEGYASFCRSLFF